jgi:hypothetical protein
MDSVHASVLENDAAIVFAAILSLRPRFEFGVLRSRVADQWDKAAVCIEKDRTALGSANQIRI